MNKVAFSAVFIILFGAYVFSQRLNPPEMPPATQAQIENTPVATTGGESQVASAPTQKTATMTKGAPTAHPATPPAKAVGQYKDGSYTGVGADAYYGTIQVKAIVSGGKLADVQFLSYPNDRQHSIQVNDYARPILAQEAIQAQSAQVDGASGATFSSQAFIQSLASALAQAKN
jgi:uncharacterized protein with FMN-binding domain